MPTILTHAVVPLALGVGLGLPRRLIVAGMLASIIPDFDVLAFRFHVPYANQFGHRGASHSLLFALALGIVALAFARRLRAASMTTFCFIAFAAASHPLLDMLTNGGLGVALLWPWSAERFFAPWHPIEVSPLTLRRVFSARGVAVLQSELLWVWLPALCGTAALLAARSVGARFFHSPSELRRSD